jgi:hypothetical protein
METYAFYIGGIQLANIDEASGTIKDVRLITAGSALGYNVDIDGTTIDQIVQCAASYKNGVKVKLNHDGGAGDIPGYVNNIRKMTDSQGEYLIGDLNLFANHPQRNYILELAKTIPDTFGLSCFFIGKPDMVDNRKKARCARLFSCDLVTEPAANPSLFSIGPVFHALGGPGSGPQPGGGSGGSKEDNKDAAHHSAIAKVHRDTAESLRQQAASIEKDSPGNSTAKEMRAMADEHEKSADEEIGKIKGNVPMPGGHVALSRITEINPVDKPKKNMTPEEFAAHMQAYEASKATAGKEASIVPSKETHEVNEDGSERHVITKGPVAPANEAGKPGTNEEDEEEKMAMRLSAKVLEQLTKSGVRIAPSVTQQETIALAAKPGAATSEAKTFEDICLKLRTKGDENGTKLSATDAIRYAIKQNPVEHRNYLERCKSEGEQQYEYMQLSRASSVNGSSLPEFKSKVEHWKVQGTPKPANT